MSIASVIFLSLHIYWTVLICLFFRGIAAKIKSSHPLQDAFGDFLKNPLTTDYGIACLII
ncbi:hypothetical protein CCP4SC76_3090003 [Gammaproteobacteria bacterium]